MVAAAYGNEACTVKDGWPGSSWNRAADLLCHLAHQPVQLTDTTSAVSIFKNIFILRKEDKWASKEATGTRILVFSLPQ